MSNTGLIARREFLQRVRTRGFWMTTLGMPLLLLVIWFYTGALGSSGGTEAASVSEPSEPVQVTAVGYVDLVGVLSPVSVPEWMIAYPGEEEAEQALRSRSIEAYIVFPEDYRTSGVVRRVSLGLPRSEPETDLVQALLAKALVADADPVIAERLLMPLGPAGIEARVSEPVSGSSGGLNMLPLVVAVMILVPLFTGGSVLGNSLAHEKESRVMEVLLVSLNPRELLTGKLLGMGALIIMQYLGWGVAIGLVSQVGQIEFGPLLQGLNLSAPQFGLILLYAVGAFVLYAAVMAGLGAMMPDVHSGQNLVTIITLPMLIPLYLWVALVNAPQGGLAVALSLIPWSAPITMIMRLTVAAVPAWQIGTSLVLLGATCVLTIRLMSRLFRAQVLLSGEALTWARLVRALRA